MEEDRTRRIRDFITRFEWQLWRRIFLAFLLLTITIIGIGSSVTLSVEESSQIQENLEQLIPDDPTATFILRNNFGIASLLFIPALGPAVGLYVLYNTGLAIAAMAQEAGFPGILVLLGLLLLPFSWLEFVSYSVAMTQSVLLTLGLLRRRPFKTELIRTALLWAAVFALLLVAAFIEMLFVG